MLSACFGSQNTGSEAGNESHDAAADASGSEGDASPDAGSGSSTTPESGSTSGEGGVASGMALNLTSLPSGAFNYTQGTYIESFRFTANSAVVVTQLGYYDASLAGATQTFAATPVGLYDMTTNALLGSVTVQPSDPVTGIFRFATLATPITLDTTDTYAVVGVTGTNDYAAGFTYGDQINPSLTWVGFGGDGSNNLTQTSALVEPNFFWSTGAGDIGPNLLIGPR